MNKLTLNVMDLGRRAYQETWNLQQEIHAKRVKSAIPDTLILVEHPHVYTLGKNADQQNLIATQEYLKKRGIDVIQVDRGGDITYHGPGQLVGYPIFNLKSHMISVRRYVATVEEVLINLLKEYHIQGRRLQGLTGVWVDNEKVAALGMRVSKWVTMHGFALNVFTDLSLFGGIIPCGITTKGITRLADLDPTVQWEEVKSKVVAQFKSLFGFVNVQFKSGDHHGQ